MNDLVSAAVVEVGALEEERDLSYSSLNVCPDALLARIASHRNGRARRPREGRLPRKPDEHDCTPLRILAATSTVDAPPP